VRAAPPVSVQGTGGLPWRMLRAGLPALASGALAAWGLGHAGLPAWPALAIAVAVAAAAWPLVRQRPVALAWDGQRWTADGASGAIEVMIDAGAGLLLRWRADGPQRQQRWVAVTAREAGTAMHALRSAAYARAQAPTGPAAASPGGLPRAR